MPQLFRCHIGAKFCQRPLQFLLAERHKMIDITDVYIICDGSLGLGVVHILRNHFPELTDGIAVHQRSPHLVVAVGHNIFEVTRTPIRGHRPPQFLVPEGHNIR